MDINTKLPQTIMSQYTQCTSPKTFQAPPLQFSVDDKTTEASNPQMLGCEFPFS
jgi:hypothetical protein